MQFDRAAQRDTRDAAPKEAAEVRAGLEIKHPLAFARIASAPLSRQRHDRQATLVAEVETGIEQA